MPLVTCPCEEMAPMKQVQRDGIEIDVCTKCRGVWLDRGELEKLISAVQTEADARIAAAVPPAAPQPAPQTPPQPWPAPQAQPAPYPPQRPYGYGEKGEYGERGEYGEGGHYDPRYGYRKKKFGIFDIFD